MGPGGVSWNLSFMLMERWKLFLQSLLRTKDKTRIRKRNPCVKRLQSWRASLHHGEGCVGGTEAGWKRKIIIICLCHLPGNQQGPVCQTCQ